MALRVVLADDSYLAREAVVHVLAEAPDIEVVATCDDRDSLLEAIERERPGVVVMDIRMPSSGRGPGLRGSRHRDAADRRGGSPGGRRAASPHTAPGRRRCPQPVPRGRVRA